MLKVYGVPAAPGYVVGKVFLLDVEKIEVAHTRIPPEKVDEQIADFKEAVLKTKAEIKQIRDKVSSELGPDQANIFNAHLLVLDDPLLIVEVTQKVKNEQVNVSWALWEVLESLIANLASLDDEYLRERVIDIHDIGRRVLQNLVGIERINLEELEEEAVIISHNLTPSDTAQMQQGKIIGFATDIGGQTSHTAIMARALEIPAVVGLKNITMRVKSGQTIIINGSEGLVIIDPDQETIHEYQRKKEEFEAFKVGLEWLKDLPAQTKDGYRLIISANIEFPEEMEIVKHEGAEGVGLYRTEFLYLNRANLPTEEEQLSAYKQVICAAAPHPVTIRTLDLGGDKFLSHWGMPTEVNPFLGLRAIRLSLRYPDIFRTQLRAILRASAFGKARVMFPLISDRQEVLQSREFLKEVKDELRRKGLDFDQNIELGIMIETPSAAVTTDILAKEVDFFSIGTNDLIQYTLAVDRINEEIAHLYNPLQPAILRLIKQTINAAHKEGKWVGMCGEMASNPLFVLVLLGLGLDEFSMVSGAIPKVKELIRSVTIKEAKEVANRILALDNPLQIEDVLKDIMYGRFGYLLDELG